MIEELPSVLCLHRTNILLDEHFVAKLGDFGFARQIPKFEAGKSFYHISASYGTPGYQAPECARGEISSKVDVFSFGVVSLLHMLML